MDFDNHSNDPELWKAIKSEVLKVNDYLLNTLEINRKSFDWYFTGRGFTLVLYGEAFLTFQQKRLWNVFQHMHFMIADKLNLRHTKDEIDSRRVIGVENRLNFKLYPDKKRHNIRLSSDELTLPINDIIKLSSKVRNLTKREIFVDVKAQNFFRRCLKKYKEFESNYHLDKKDSAVNTELRLTFSAPCEQRWYDEGAKEGMRRAIAFMLACGQRQQHVPIDKVKTSMRDDWNTRNKPPLTAAEIPEQLIKVIENAYKLPNTYSCTNQYRRDKCIGIETCTYLKKPIEKVDVDLSRHKESRFEKHRSYLSETEKETYEAIIKAEKKLNFTAGQWIVKGLRYLQGLYEETTDLHKISKALKRLDKVGLIEYIPGKQDPSLHIASRIRRIIPIPPSGNPISDGT
jgi:hypothetical protein